jgi:hypothetical protein
MEATNAWVFISHSNKDFDKILRVRNKLEALQYKPLLFFLKCLDDDKEIFELIKREIKARDRFILCDSKNSRESEWVQKEKELIISLNRPYEIINTDGTEDEIDEIDSTACLLSIRSNDARIYVTAKEAFANWELYNEVRYIDGTQSICINESTLADRNDAEVADKIVLNLMELDSYQYCAKIKNTTIHNS